MQVVPNIENENEELSQWEKKLSASPKIEQPAVEHTLVVDAPSEDAESNNESGWALFDSKATQLDDELLLKFEHAFHNPTSQVMLHEIAQIATDYDPIDIAHASTRLPISVRHLVFRYLPDIRAKISFIVHVSPATQAAVFRYIRDEEIAKLVEQMPPDEAVEVLDALTTRRRKKVLDLIDSKKADRIRLLLQHGRDTAGRLMTNEFFAFHFATTIKDVVQAIRTQPGIELTNNIYVVNEEQKLIGYVPQRNMLINSPMTPLKNVMRPIVHTIEPGAYRDEVVDLFERYQLADLPVVEDNKLVGVITYKDVVEVMEDIADETIASIGGTAENVGENEPIIKRFFARAPWLVVTVFAGLATATGLSQFQSEPWFFVVPFFIPLIAGMSGNVGIQCSTILVRGMATGEISFRTRWEVAFRELKIGLLIGLVFGILCGISVFWLNNIGLYHFAATPVTVGTIVSCGVFGACITASLLGTLSPLFFARLSIDPAIASGPIVTACNDVSSTFMYCFVAKSVSFLFQM